LENLVNIRNANLDDLDPINIIANAHRRELGFVRKVTLAESISRKEILIVENDEQVIGFVHYRHRRDSQTTLYNIVVLPERRRQGIGKRLVDALVQEAQSLGKQCIVLKSPSELPANEFYLGIGFHLWQKEPGKQRELNLWRLYIPSRM
jgi:ribosomal protein S18 acetylase RimI-like enzyme